MPMKLWEMVLNLLMTINKSFAKYKNKGLQNIVALCFFWYYQVYLIKDISSTKWPAPANLSMINRQYLISKVIFLHWSGS